MVSANDAPHQPGMLPLELQLDSTASYGQIPIPKFPRRLLFSPVPAYGGRRVEWVPEWVAQYMKDRFNRHGRLEFSIATDLVQQKNTFALKDQLRDLLREIMQEPWFQAAISGNSSAAQTSASEPAKEPEAPASASPIASATRPYKPGGRLVARKPPAKYDLTEEQELELKEQELVEV